jgi:hypothetical protein
MSNAIPQPSPITVCTLWEGDYHKGLGALTNSLIQAGYHGTVWAGYRGSLPAWASKSEVSGAIAIFQATATVRITFVKLETPMHLTQYKPIWMKQVLAEHEPAAAGIVYFDPDIFLLAPWTFFEEWIQVGVAVCEDIGAPLNPSHPRVYAWSKFAADAGLTVRRPTEANLNGGLVGVTRDRIELLDHWAQLMSELRRRHLMSNVMHQGDRAQHFHIPDQDALNIAAMTFSGPISRIGPDGMGFSQGEWLTIHAIQTKKPWRRRLLWDYFTSGVEIERGTRVYWTRFAAGPVRIEPIGRLRVNRFLVRLVAFLSRFYRRR